jgi:hypothetical protein
MDRYSRALCVVVADQRYRVERRRTCLSAAQRRTENGLRFSYVAQRPAVTP